MATAAAGTGIHAEVEGCGMATAPGEPDPFADAVAALIDDSALRERLGAAALRRAGERWSREAVADRFEQAALGTVRRG